MNFSIFNLHRKGFPKRSTKTRKMEPKWRQDEAKPGSNSMKKAMSKKQQKMMVQSPNIEPTPKSLPKTATLFGANVQDVGLRPVQAPSKSPRASNMFPQPSQDLLQGQL